MSTFNKIYIGLLFQNQQLKELQNSVNILGKVHTIKALTGHKTTGILEIISEYAYSLDILDQYD